MDMEELVLPASMDGRYPDENDEGSNFLDHGFLLLDR